MDVFHGVAPVRDLLHLLPQKEHADKILRRRRHHQISERGFLRCQHRLAVATVLFPQVDQCIGRRIMIFRGSLRRLAAHAACEQAADRTEIHRLREQALLVRPEPPEDCIFHGVTDMALLRHRINEPQRLRPPGVDGLARQHHGHRLKRADQMRKARGAAKAGVQAKHHFRKTEARIVDGNARVAGQRHFEAATKTKAVDHGHGWNLEGFQPVHHSMSTRHPRFDLARIAHTTKLVDIRARDEARRLCRADDDACGAILLQRRDHSLELYEHVLRQRIRAGAFAVKQQPRDAIVIAGQFEIPVRPCSRLRSEFEHAVPENIHDA